MRYALGLLSFLLLGLGCVNPAGIEPFAKRVIIHHNSIIRPFAVKGDWKNPLCGQFYRSPGDLPALAMLEDAGGSLLPSRNPNVDFAVSHLFNPSDSASILVFEKIVRSEGEKAIRYQIFDTLHLPYSPETYVQYCSCLLNGAVDEQIIASVYTDNQDTPYFENVRAAWKADIASGRILPLHELSGIKCINEGYGCSY